MRMSETHMDDPVFGVLVKERHYGLWWSGQVTLPLPLPGGATELHLSPEGERVPSEARREAGRAALARDDAARARLETMLHDNYEEVRDDLLEMDDPMFPEPPDISTPDAVWEHVTLTYLEIPEHGNARGRYFRLGFECDWEAEHGCEVLFRDGRPVQLTRRGGTSLPGWRDEQERKAAGGTGT